MRSKDRTKQPEAADDAAPDTISVVATGIPPAARFPDFHRELASKLYSRLRAEGVRESDIDIGITQDRKGFPEIVIRILPYAKPPYFSFASESEDGKQTGTVISFACDRKFIDIILAEYSKQAKIFEAKIHGESEKSRYSKGNPPSRPDDASQDRMRDDFNTTVKKAKAETLARGKPRLSATHQLATYRALVRNVDLLNPELPESERLTRARRLVHAYERLRDRRPTFHDHNNKELLAAFSIVNKEKYRRRQAAKAAQKAALAMGVPPDIFQGLKTC